MSSGWREAKAPDGKAYYYHPIKGTTWERPAEMDGAASATPVAPTGPAAEQLTAEHIAAGWSAVNDATGKTYYWNRGTNKTSWSLPAAPLVPADSQVAGPGSFVTSSFDRNGDGPPARSYDRRDQRGRPDNDGPRGGGNRWEPGQGGGGFRGAMPAKTDEPEYSTVEQAREAFFKLLRKHNIKYNTPWPEAMRQVIRERDYRAIKDPRDRQLAFEDFCVEQRVEEKSKEKEKQAKVREDFRAMLKTHDEIKHYTRWKTARPMIEREIAFRNADDEDERRQMFAEYRYELSKRHAEEERQTRTKAQDQLSALMRLLVVDPYTRWTTAQETVMNSEAFKDNQAMQSLHKMDVLAAFNSHLKNLEQDLNRKKQDEKGTQAVRERQARDEFRDLLQERVRNGMIGAGSKWQDFVPFIDEDVRYTSMIGNAGSSPQDLFWDIVEEEEQKVRSKRNDALDILDDQRYEMTPETSLEEFTNVMNRDPRSASWSKLDMNFVHARLMEKIMKRAEEDKINAERSQRKAMDALRSVIKGLEPAIRIDDTYEDTAPRLERFREYQALDDETRRKAFAKQIRRLQEKAELDRERDGYHRSTRERTLDRAPERERDTRDHRRSYDYDRSDRRRTRTPEVDAYEADRRKAQADRERQFRKPSFGLTPPPRERRDDRGLDRERERSRDRGVYDGRERRSDRYESMYERERREREAERERNYASRADPRDRGKNAVLDYGDDEVVGSSRPGSVRKRRESEASMVRDTKRSRRSKEPEIEVEKEDVAMQSGSEEGEIEEV